MSSHRLLLLFVAAASLQAASQADLDSFEKVWTTVRDRHWQTKPGNLYSKPVKMHIDPRANKTIRISLSEQIPSVEEETGDVENVLDWGRGYAHPVGDNKWVKHIRIQSELLTKFWGRPTYLGAIILLRLSWKCWRSGSALTDRMSS